MKYSHRKVEQKGQTYWQQQGSFNTRDRQTPKKFVLDMFPYPSGPGLHVGHIRGGTASDILTRMYRMQNYSVLHPMGWDGFGLPAEQYANQTQQDPAQFTPHNINRFRHQIRRFGFSYDFAYEINTTDPHYFRWTQMMFLGLLQARLAVRQLTTVNYCPALNTVLANEEVKLQHHQLVSERGAHPVIMRRTRQGVVKITAYAEQLRRGLATLDGPVTTKKLQTNGIGITRGYEVRIKLQTCAGKQQAHEEGGFVRSAAALKRLTFIALSVDHPLLVTPNSPLDAATHQFVTRYQNLPDLVRTNPQLTPPRGMRLSGDAYHPQTRQKLSVWVVNYLSSTAQDQLHMGMPVADNHDHHFARLHNIPLTMPTGVTNANPRLRPARRLHLRDGIFSRQRFWGEPIPVFYRPSAPDHPVALPPTALPLQLPPGNATLQTQPPTADLAPLARYQGGTAVYQHGKLVGQRETNTMPQWAGSSWYYLAYVLRDHKRNDYLDPRSGRGQARIKRWLPVDLYMGGQEHATSHLLYARFWYRFLFNQQVVPSPEPFQWLFHQGMILAPDGKKMSKSLGNAVSVDPVLMSHGADAIRLCCMFLGPLSAAVAWSRSTLDACRRGLDRVYELVTVHGRFTHQPNPELTAASQRLVANITTKIERLQFNTAVSELMVFINHCYAGRRNINRRCFANFVRVMSPFAPHLAQELWQLLGYHTDLTWERGPVVSPATAAPQQVKIPVQVNNRLKLILQLPTGLSAPQVKTQLQIHAVLGTYFNRAKRVIIVPDKAVNILI